MSVDLMNAATLAYEDRNIQRFKQLVMRWTKAEKKTHSTRKTTDDVQRFRDLLVEANVE